MPMMDKLALGKRARELGFARDAFEKMSRLTEVLRYIGSEGELRPLLALKGGTAINLTIFNLPRLSVDIDLDFTENLKREEMESQRKQISEVLGRFMTSSGYNLRDKSKHTHALDSFVYAYTNAAGNTDNIKIEINYLLRSHILPAVDAVSTNEIFPDLSVRTLSPIEIFASKIVALSSRAAVRDVYDLNNMISSGLFEDKDTTMLRKCAVFYMIVAGASPARGFTLDKAESLTQHRVKTDLLPMLRGSEWFDLQAARERISGFINEHMTLTEKETAFVKRFAAGHYQPELLFEDNEIAERIENHPMALWRQRSIRYNHGER